MPARGINKKKMDNILENVRLVADGQPLQPMQRNSTYYMTEGGCEWPINGGWDKVYKAAREHLAAGGKLNFFGTKACVGSKFDSSDWEELIAPEDDLLANLD
jgi:hypothetical protein